MATEEAVMAVIRASRPSFRNPHDKIAFALHATFLASGYNLLATGAPALAESAVTSPPSEEVGVDGWNESDESYGFLYTKEDKGSKRIVLVKCLVMGDQLIIDALSSKDQNKEPSSLQINVNDYDGGNASNSYADKYKDFKRLVETFSQHTLSKLGDAAAPPPTSSSSRPSNRVFPPIFPGGHDDVLPGPGAGIYPRGGPDIGGPMLIGPNDPRWFRPGGGQPGFPDGLQGVPPGARFDPYGPPGVRGFEPNRFGRNPRRPGNHPDLEPFRDSDFI